MTRTILFVCIVALGIGCCIHKDDYAAPNGGDAKAVPLPDDPEALISIILKEDGRHVAAFKKLSKAGENVLPTLLAHLSDDRVLPDPSLQVWDLSGPATVGTMCRQFVYDMIAGKGEKWHSAVFGISISNLKLWYTQRKGWTLGEMKAEVLKYKIMTIKKAEPGSRWKRNPKEASELLSKFENQLKDIGVTVDSKQYAWERPTTLTKQGSIAIAKAYFSNKKKLVWKDYPEHFAGYDAFTDCWYVLVSDREVSKNRYHYARVLIADDTSEILDFWDGIEEFDDEDDEEGDPEAENHDG